MKRIDVYYDGHLYSVGERELEDLKSVIIAGQAGPGSAQGGLN